MKSREAAELFSSGCNCSQTVVIPYLKEMGIDRGLIERISVGFGASIERQGKTCGCISGAIMVLGLKHGNETTSNIENRMKSYRISKDFIKSFKDIYTHTECSDLIKLDLNKAEGLEEAKRREVFSNRCSLIVKKTVELLESQLSNL